MSAPWSTPTVAPLQPRQSARRRRLGARQEGQV